MADNLTTQTTVSTVPSGSVIATDDVGGVHFQKVKLDVGGDGASTPISGTVPVSGTVAVTQSGTWDEVGINDSGNSITVDGTVTAAAQPGVDIGDVTVNNAAGAAAVNVQDGGNSLTVDGSVSVSGAVDTELTTADLDTGAGTDTRAVVGLVGSASGGGALIPGDATNGLFVQARGAAGAAEVGTIADGTSAAPGLVTKTFVEIFNGTTYDRARGDTTNGLDVDVTRLPALVAGTANIGDVDVLTVPAPLSTTGGGTEATALRVTVASDSTGVLSVDDNAGSLTVDGTVSVNLNAGTATNEVVGDVAHSVAAAGNPLLIAGISVDNDDTAPPNRVDAESDATRLATDRDGALYVRTHGPQEWSYHLNTSTAQTDTSVHAAPGAGLSLYVGTVVFSSGAATAINMFLEEGATTVLGPWYLEAVAGRGMAVQFNPPKKITANTALTLTTSASIAHSVDITGFVGQG